MLYVRSSVTDGGRADRTSEGRPSINEASKTSAEDGARAGTEEEMSSAAGSTVSAAGIASAGADAKKGGSSTVGAKSARVATDGSAGRMGAARGRWRATDGVRAPVATGNLLAARESTAGSVMVEAGAGAPERGASRPGAGAGAGSESALGTAAGARPWSRPCTAEN